MKKSTIILGILLLAAMVGGLILVNQNQNTQRGAAFSTTKLSLLPSEKIVAKVGDSFAAHLWFYTDNGAKVDNVQAVICYDPKISLGDTDATAKTDAGFDSDVLVVTKDRADGKKCSTIVATSKKDAAALKTTAEAVTLNFKAVAVGDGTIDIDKANSTLTGDNPASDTDKVITVTTVENASYSITDGTATVTDTPTPTPDETGPALSFKFTFAGVDQGVKCAVNWPLKVVLLSADKQTKTIDNVTAANTGDVVDVTINGATHKLMVYQATVHIGNMPTSNLAVFVKGPKHLQMKFGMDGQDKPYGKQGGEICVGSNCPQTYNFTKYPMLPGDVDQNGWINAQDFSKVKTEAEKFTTVDEGKSLVQDLDGSCQANSRDVTLLVNSLDTKQEELY